MSDNFAVLLTATINPKNISYVKIDDVSERLRDYVKSIIMWILFSNASSIVFCENSNYPLDYNPFYQLAELEKKNLEIITFDGNEKSATYGKGFGEGIILEYALNNSNILGTVTSFYKITGRLFVKNFNELSKLHEGDLTVFNKTSPRSKLADTRFFKTEVKFYKEYLIYEYKKVRDHEGTYLEHVFYEKLHGQSIPCFKRYPRYYGRSGSSGDIYKDTKWKLLTKDILAILSFYKI